MRFDCSISHNFKNIIGFRLMTIQTWLDSIFLQNKIHLEIWVLFFTNYPIYQNAFWFGILCAIWLRNMGILVWQSLRTYCTWNIFSDLSRTLTHLVLFPLCNPRIFLYKSTPLCITSSKCIMATRATWIPWN